MTWTQTSNAYAQANHWTHWLALAVWFMPPEDVMQSLPDASRTVRSWEAAWAVLGPIFNK